MSQSPPSPASSNASIDQPEPPDAEPTLEDLVAFFLASKRSLAITTHVWRANEIVTSARQALEDNAVLAARNAFVRRAISDQITTVETIHKGVDLVSSETQEDFQAAVHACDEYSNNLNSAIDVLRTTDVDPSFRPEGEQPKQLYDFVDEGGVQGLHDAIRMSIDRYNDAHGVFEERIEELGSAIGDIKGHLIAALRSQTAYEDEPEAQEGGPVTQNEMVLSTEAASPLPSLFLNLENHATECAGLLQSLVRHYDLCVTALKHTEGGGAAIEQATGSQANEQDFPRELGLKLESIGQDAPPQPMFEEERANMLAVLRNDASEVEDVMGEIRDRLADMEEQFSHIESYVTSLRISAQKLHATLRRLCSVVSEVDIYVDASTTFLTFWNEEKEFMAVKQEELESLRDFYENFASAYDNLLLEVGRRRNVQVAMDKVVKEAQKKLEQLYLDDVEERENWKTEIGEYLPSDIWSGLEEGPCKYEIRKIDGPVAGVPKVPKEVLEMARKRLEALDGGAAI